LAELPTPADIIQHFSPLPMTQVIQSCWRTKDPDIRIGWLGARRLGLCRPAEKELPGPKFPGDVIPINSSLVWSSVLVGPFVR